MITINVKDLISSEYAITQSDGTFVGKAAAPFIRQGQQVVFDFKGISEIVTSFAVSMIDIIMQQGKPTRVRELINFVNLPHEFDLAKVVSTCERFQTDSKYRDPYADITKRNRGRP